MNEKIQEMIDALTEEQQRVKMFINNSGFDCTTAPFVIAKQYRDALKQHIVVLRSNLED